MPLPMALPRIIGIQEADIGQIQLAVSLPDENGMHASSSIENAHQNLPISSSLNSSQFVSQLANFSAPFSASDAAAV